MINEEVVRNFEKLTRYAKWNRERTEELSKFIRENIDPKCKDICPRCPAKIRWSLKRIKTWADKPNIKEEFARVRSERIKESKNELNG